MTDTILKDLARAKALFQLRAITAAMGIEAMEAAQCTVCGDYHERDEIPLTCQTGDGE